MPSFQRSWKVQGVSMKNSNSIKQWQLSDVRSLLCGFFQLVCRKYGIITQLCFMSKQYQLLKSPIKFRQLLSEEKGTEFNLDQRSTNCWNCQISGVHQLTNKKNFNNEQIVKFIRRHCQQNVIIDSSLNYNYFAHCVQMMIQTKCVYQVFQWN
ncbi:Hypothetical_protein [Hexamita inflata]|uniref:Hypothetical_protein n=1 Tax=Hexamita inflata TaxID=28002 RepID=A0AA86UEZ8_9EUKA|nr:Hypothetical protein HINF_LOCUS25968 [Hexamita inflata]